MKKTETIVNPELKDHLKVKKGIYGFGLFADVPIKKGTFIIQYVGKMLTADEANEKGGQYLFEINSKWTIDGTDRKNLARYINHSCRPNCESDTDERNKKVYISAIKNITPGEELCYDYGKEFWKEYIKPKGCRCAKCQQKNA